MITIKTTEKLNYGIIFKYLHVIILDCEEAVCATLVDPCLCQGGCCCETGSLGIRHYVIKAPTGLHSHTVRASDSTRR